MGDHPLGDHPSGCAFLTLFLSAILKTLPIAFRFGSIESEDLKDRRDTLANGKDANTKQESLFVLRAGQIERYSEYLEC